MLSELRIAAYGRVAKLVWKVEREDMDGFMKAAVGAGRVAPFSRFFA
jgi:hypothetical protein